MDPSTRSSPTSTTLELLSYYSLEGNRYPKPISKAQVLNRWLQSYPEQLVRLALIESLYQGRYKMISVEQLLALWCRRGQPTYHFNHEFEALVCRDVPHQMEQAVAFMSSDRDLADRDLGDRDLDQQNPAATLSPASGRMALVETSEFKADLIDSETPVDLKDTSRENSQNEDDIEYLVDDFEKSLGEARPSILSSVLASNCFLPLTLHRLGLEPIHQFMPDAEPVEFCERLAAIARSSS
jgi:hypothetical protein